MSENSSLPPEDSVASPPPAPPDAALVRPQPEATPDPLQWLRTLFAANPFYLASLLLILYGAYRVSSDTGSLRIETHQLFFNFTALQFYEMALVGLAILLARRTVWYDSTLLVLIDSLVLIVPLLLVTQASLIDQSWIWGFSGAVVALAMTRVGLLKRGFKELNLPPRLLILGAALLAANVILPIVYRELQEERMGKNIASGPAYHMNEISWLVILPLLLAGTNLLPKPRRAGNDWPQKRWLPFVLFGAWILGSGVHLYALSYVYTFEMRGGLWVPAFLALAWTLHNRVHDIIERPPGWVRVLLISSPFALPLVALASADVPVALAALCVNATLYLWIARCGEDYRPLAYQLALASGVGALNGLPHLLTSPGAAPALVFLQDITGVGQSFVGYLFLVALLSRKPAMGLLGAATTAVILGVLLLSDPAGLHWAVQGAALFLLLHSLRWEEPPTRAAAALRWSTVAASGLHALIWVAVGGPGGQLTVGGGGILVVWLLVWWMTTTRPPLAVGVGGATTALSGPLMQSVVWAGALPAGPLAMLGSFALLGVGTVLALTKHRWHRTPREKT